MILLEFPYSRVIRINTNTFYHSAFKNSETGLQVLHFHLSETLLGSSKLNYK